MLIYYNLYINYYNLLDMCLNVCIMATVVVIGDQACLRQNYREHCKT